MLNNECNSRFAAVKMRLWIRPEYLAQYAAPIDTRSYGTLTKDNIVRLMNYFNSETIECVEAIMPSVEVVVFLQTQSVVACGK